MEKRTPSEIAKFFGCHLSIGESRRGGRYYLLTQDKPKYNLQFNNLLPNGKGWHEQSFTVNSGEQAFFSKKIIVDFDINSIPWDSGYWNPLGEFIECGE